MRLPLALVVSTKIQSACAADERGEISAYWSPRTCSGISLIRLRTTYVNWATVKSPGTRNFFLSMSASLLPLARSTMHGILSL